MTLVQGSWRYYKDLPFLWQVCAWFPSSWTRLPVLPTSPRWMGEHCLGEWSNMWRLDSLFIALPLMPIIFVHLGSNCHSLVLVDSSNYLVLQKRADPLLNNCRLPMCLIMNSTEKFSTEIDECRWSFEESWAGFVEQGWVEQKCDVVIIAFMS